jgi:pSer/pThr/pTyr-binding forkhead associated (FHA) protein
MTITVTIALAEGGKLEPTFVERKTFDLAEVTIGSGPGCDLLLPHDLVGQLHARLVRKGGAYALIDEGSVEGTFLGGVRLPPKTPQPIAGAASLSLGPYRLELAPGAVVGLAAAGNVPGSTYSLAIALVEQANERFNVSAGPAIEVLDGPDRRNHLPLAEGRTYVFGRDRSADLPLTEPKASRRHVKLTFRGGSALVRDLGSSNGTLLGGKPLSSDADVAWPLGMELRIGDDVFVYRNPSKEAINELERRAAAVLEAPSAPDSRSLDASISSDLARGTAEQVAPGASASERSANATDGASTAAVGSDNPPASTLLRDGTHAPVAELPATNAPPPSKVAERRPAQRRLSLFDALILFTASLVLVATVVALWMLVS